MSASRPPVETAADVLRRFARSTNLIVAGRRFEIHGSGQLDAALRSLLIGIGARPRREGEKRDLVFVTGGYTELLREDAGLADATADAPLIIVDAVVDGPSIDTADFPTAIRSGVLQDRSGARILVTRDGDDVSGVDDAARRIRFAHRFMPTSSALADELAATGLADDVTIGVSMVLEPKTAVLVRLLADAGAVVVVYAHADETDDDVADALRADGFRVFASSTASAAEQLALALQFLDSVPRILLDDGSHLIRLAHTERPALLETAIGAAEETTSGLRALRTMADLGLLGIPVIAVNDARSKTLFDNFFGTGQSCVFAILDLLESQPGGADLTGRPVAIVGFGPVGQGVAHHVAALGGIVTISETDPVRALLARFSGFRVAPVHEAVGDADLVISATGVAHTLDLDVLLACADDAVIAVAGGVPQEVAVDASLRAGATRSTIGHRIERMVLPGGRRIRLLDDGGCINITAAEGNPIEIMDLSFAVQLSAVRMLLEHPLAPGVHPVSAASDLHIAATALAVGGLAVDPSKPAESSDSGWESTRFEVGE